MEEDLGTLFSTYKWKKPQTKSIDKNLKASIELDGCSKVLRVLVTLSNYFLFSIMMWYYGQTEVIKYDDL